MPTPNPLCLKFLPGKDVLGPGNSKEYTSLKEATDSLLARRLFSIDGVSKLLYGPDFISITRKEEADWEALKPEILAGITEFFINKNSPPLIKPPEETTSSPLDEEHKEIIEMIKDLIKVRIKPLLNDDGGDVEYRSFDFTKGVT